MDRMTAAYDDFAGAYTDENETSLMNAYYERPATLALVGDAAGRRILDAGCGSGPLFAALREKGAVVTGFDQSAAMVEHARRRLVHEHRSPLALGSVDPFLEPAAAGSRLDHGGQQIRLADVMGARPPAVEAGGEDGEGVRARRFHREALANGEGGQRVRHWESSAALRRRI